MFAFATLVALLPALALATPLDYAARSLNRRYTDVLIKSGRDGLCISVDGGMHAAITDGTAVVSVPCSQATTWNINPGSGSVLVARNPAYALDAGTNPGNNGALKIWTSYPGLYQQTWYLTGDNRIAITGGNQCLDEGTNGIQTYQCTTGNTNQVFYTVQSGGTSTSSSASHTATSTSASASSTPSGVSPSIPSGTVYPDPPAGDGQRLHPYGRSDLCVSALGGAPQVGSEVEITYCFDNNDANSKAQLWDLPAEGATGPVRLINTDLCLDVGNNPANGAGAKVWTCYDGLLQQTWKRNGDNFALTNGQCLDVEKGSTGQKLLPYSALENIQTWQCSNNGDVQQIFYTL